MFLYNEEKTKYITFKSEDYRIGELKHTSEKIELEEIDALTNHPGPADPEMGSVWNEMEIANSIRSECQWVKIEAKSDDNYYICVLDKSRLIEVP